MGAKCSKCKVDVGCSCDLIPKWNTKTGVCAACASAQEKAAAIKKIPNDPSPIVEEPKT